MLQKREKTIAGDERQTLDAVVVGAGAGGLYALLRLKREGRTVRLFEAGSEVGGTWYWNNYPGARVDVPSLEYSYSFDRALQQEWVWPERYSAQPQLQAYFSHVADRYGLRDQITFETKVVSAEFDESRSLWKVRTDGGEVVWARFFIVATGPLSEPIFPKIEGMSTFKGTSVHTGRWKTDGADVAHKRVGVIGTGSSGAQIAPELAKTARKLHLLQRTPAYSVPSQNKVLDAQEIAHLKSNYDAIREHARANRSALGIDVNDVGAFEVSEDERQRIFEERWQYGGLGFTAAFGDLYLDVDANKTAADFVRQKIREIVEDADVADRLMPDTLIGAKRLCVDNGYFQMFNRDNVELVDLRENPVLEIDETGIVTAQGHIDLDVIVYATGFDAFTGSILKIDIRGRGGKELKAVWDSGPRTYLGLCVAGFPNMFIVNGPGSPAGLANMVTLAETEVDWIVDCIQSIDRQGKSEIEAIQEKQDCWGRTLNEMAEQTIYPLANSWYVGANVPGKPRNFMSHLDYPEYVRSCRASAESGYADFRVEQSVACARWPPSGAVRGCLSAGRLNADVPENHHERFHVRHRKGPDLMDAVGVAELEKSLSEGAIRTVACAIPDIWGRLVGKRLTTNGFLEALSGAGGVHASSYLFASDMEMEPRPGFKLTNWDDGFSDFIMRPDLTTFRILPWQDGTALVLCDAVEEHTGDFLQMAPRTILKKQLDRAKGLGLTLKCATELEFFLFRTDYDEAWKKRYRDLAPTSRYRADYHLLQSTRDEDFIGLVRDRLADAGIAVENAKTEWGLGQQEITLNYCDALMMADRHALYKHWVKEAASEFGYSATFMAKPFIEEVGSSCHIHASLWDANTGQPISHETGEPAGMSRRFASFVAGMIQGGREYSYLSAPSINSYKRFQDESFAPCQMVLGLDNRTCGFRLVGEGASFRVESRLPGADANPYLALAGLVSSGLDGFEANLAAPETYQGNAYENHSLPRVPSTMREAVSLFSNGEKVRSALGADVHEHLVNFAAQELRSFEQETVTDWEMMRYFERI